MTDQAAAPIRHEDVVSPFCALGCDDVIIEAADDGLRVVGGGDDISTPLFERPLGKTTPRVRGREVSLQEAVGQAAALLAQARFPLISGLATDTAGTQAALRLAERIGGTVDHAAADGLLATVRVMQTGGYVMATFSEVRNRADFILFFGTDAIQLMPRFFERVVWPAQRLPGTGAARRLVFLGDALDMDAGRSPDGDVPQHIPCAPERLVEAAAALRACIEKRPVRGEAPAGIPRAVLERLANEIREARYATIVWSAGSLPREDAELTVSVLCEALKTLNESPEPAADPAPPDDLDASTGHPPAARTGAPGRALGLALAGPGNAIGANQVTAWSWGVPLRSSVATGVPVYDPEGYATASLLASRRADALLWISSFVDEPPPPADVPTIALVRASESFAGDAEIVIPVGAPGLDHAGTIFRGDSIVALPLRQLRQTALPAVSEVLDDILVAMGPMAASLPGSEDDA